VRADAVTPRRPAGSPALEDKAFPPRINGFVIGPVIAAIFIAVWGTFSPSRPGFRPVRPDLGLREE
jgi:hypothetical protein